MKIKINSYIKFCISFDGPNPMKPYYNSNGVVVNAKLCFTLKRNTRWKLHSKVNVVMTAFLWKGPLVQDLD